MILSTFPVIQDELSTDERTAPLFHRLRLARIVRRVAVILFIAPVVLWVLAYAGVLAGQRHPDDGYLIVAMIYYGLFASPLLLIPVVAFFISSHRVRSLEQRLMFSTTNTNDAATAPRSNRR